jgi:hypothetical protein
MTRNSWARALVMTEMTTIAILLLFVVMVALATYWPTSD